MKTLLLVNTGNDEDIIKESLLHNERFFDDIIVCDCQSEDSTVEIIKSLNLEKLKFYSVNYEAKFQWAFNWSMIEPLRYLYDYIIVLDADEFIKADNLDELLTIPNNLVANLKWECYVPEHDVFSDFKKNITHRRTIESLSCQKIVFTQTMHGTPTLGGHYLHDANGHKIKSYDLKSIKLAHFPVRSRQQWNKKVERFSKLFGDFDRSQGYQSRNRPIIHTEEDLKNIALHYIERFENQELIYDPLK